MFNGINPASGVGMKPAMIDLDQKKNPLPGGSGYTTDNIYNS